MANKNPKFPFLYEIEVSKITTSLNELLDDIKKENKRHLKFFTPSKDIIHYDISYKKKPRVKIITLKPISYDYHIMMVVYTILDTHTKYGTVNHIYNL